ncbi:DUF2188 domain-containing protein [Curtobacterium sp. NPDC089185]|uniref:DUF2188 domain-containing protein n=1 Tax=Curtobacterium sp. NPDC089185 TaxID=3154968 RepID=UPI00343AE6B2
MSTNRDVTHNPNGGWHVRGGGDRASAHTDTQAEAIDRARQIIGNQGSGELSVHDRQGQVRAKDTIAPGNDPRIVKG